MNYRLLIAFAVMLGSCVLTYPYVRDALMHFDRAAQREFDTMPMGITLDDASSRLGSDPTRFATHLSAAYLNDTALIPNLNAPRTRMLSTFTSTTTESTGTTAWVSMAMVGS